MRDTTTHCLILHSNLINSMDHYMNFKKFNYYSKLLEYKVSIQSVYIGRSVYFVDVVKIAFRGYIFHHKIKR